MFVKKAYIVCTVCMSVCFKKVVGYSLGQTVKLTFLFFSSLCVDSEVYLYFL